jgi:hypothetical protein
MRLTAYLLLTLLAACATPGAAADSLQERYARAAAVELEGELLADGAITRIRLHAAAPAFGWLEIEREEEFFGERRITLQRWIGDGRAIFAVDEERRECAFTVAAWRDLEVLGRLPFLAPAWARSSPPLDPPACATGPGGAVLAARGADAAGEWSFRATRSRVFARARAEDYAVAPPEGFAVLDAPESEFDYVRSLLAVGEFAPEITLLGLDGAERRLSQFRGRPLLIAFWFHH